MPKHSGPELPGALLLRDALRIVRHVAREGRDVVQQGANKAGQPVRQIAGAAISQVDRVAHGAEEVAHLMLGDSGEISIPATALEAGAVNATVFAHAAYGALGHILRKIGARSWLISETRLALAFDSIRGKDEVERAASLIAAMQDHGVIAEIRVPEPLTGQKAALLAQFALMLWMLADKSPDDADEAIDAAAALTLALGDDILNAGESRKATAALLEEFRNHV